MKNNKIGPKAVATLNHIFVELNYIGISIKEPPNSKYSLQNSNIKPNQCK